MKRDPNTSLVVSGEVPPGLRQGYHELCSQPSFSPSAHASFQKQASLSTRQADSVVGLHRAVRTEAVLYRNSWELLVSKHG